MMNWMETPSHSLTHSLPPNESTIEEPKLNNNNCFPKISWYDTKYWCLDRKSLSFTHSFTHSLNKDRGQIKQFTLQLMVKVMIQQLQQTNDPTSTIPEPLSPLPTPPTHHTFSSNCKKSGPSPCATWPYHNIPCYRYRAAYNTVNNFLTATYLLYLLYLPTHLLTCTSANSKKRLLLLFLLLLLLLL